MSATPAFNAINSSVTMPLRTLVWGPASKNEAFSRWNQGFVFSEAEPSALIQTQGGPCAVLAPVQAFIVKCALFIEGSPDISSLKNITHEKATSLLIDALTEILLSMNNSEYTVVTIKDSNLSTVTSNLSNESSPSVSAVNQRIDSSCPDDQAESSSSIYNTSKSMSSVDEAEFHQRLVLCKCKNKTDLNATLLHVLPVLQSQYGVLVYLYSVLLTKEIQQIKNEVEDPTESLIDGTHGHGSQSLINLLLTSQATSNVWDNDQEISGLKLHGVQRQASIGFLTLLEHMRYCEVGWNLKNPKYPIWLLGSETHLTVFFSTNESLIVRESPELSSKQIFAQFDPEGNGFISSDLLEDLMRACDLVADTEYVELVKGKLDAEQLGIITKMSFMDEFFPSQPSDVPHSFTAYHYNGLVQSSSNGKVVYKECRAVLEDEIETQLLTDTSPIKLCIQTKWPSIELKWETMDPPSIN